MKLIPLFILLMIACVTSVQAQSTSGKYWVVEGNIYKPDYTLIYFYDSSHHLIKQEKLEGKFLDIRKKRNVTFLNRKLQNIESEGHELSTRRTSKSNKRH
jgi:hypothetical protein